MNMAAEKQSRCLAERGSEASAIQGPEAAIWRQVPWVHARVSCIHTATGCNGAASLCDAFLAASRRRWPASHQVELAPILHGAMEIGVDTKWSVREAREDSYLPGNSVSEMPERMNGGAVSEERSPETDAMLGCARDGHRQCYPTSRYKTITYDLRKVAQLLFCAAGTAWCTPCATRIRGQGRYAKRLSIRPAQIHRFSGSDVPLRRLVFRTCY